MLDTPIDPVGGRQYKAQGEWHDDDDMAQDQSKEGAAQADLREESQERDTQNDMRDHQRRQEQRRHGVPPEQAISADRQSCRGCKSYRDRRRKHTKPQTIPEGPEKLRISPNGLE